MKQWGSGELCDTNVQGGAEVTEAGDGKEIIWQLISTELLLVFCQRSESYICLLLSQ